MKLSIRVPQFLNWLFVKRDTELEARAIAFGRAKKSKRWGNEMASIEMVTSCTVSRANREGKP
jgi:hypothetical protein